MKLLKCSISMVALLAGQAAYAQEEDTSYLGELVLSANRGTETPIDETSVSVSVVTAEEIAKNSTVNTTIGDILAKTVPGVAPSTENLTNYGQTIRGRNFLTLIDGVPQTNTLNVDYRGLNGIGTSAIGQVEVIRGATSAYGFGGAGGLVNIVTKRPEEGEAVSSLGYSFKFQPGHVEDSFSQSIFATTSKTIGNFDYLVSLGAEKTGASFTPDGTRRPPDSFGSQGGLDDVENFNGLVKLGYEVDQHRIEGSVNVYNYEQDSDYAGVVGGGSFDDGISASPSEGDLNTVSPGTKNRTYNLKYINSDIFGGTMDLQVYRNEKVTTFTRTSYLGYEYPQYETESEKTGARLTFNTPISDVIDLTYGLDYITDKTVVNDIDAPSGYPELDMQGYAPFLQASIDIGGRGSLTFGVRHEVLDVSVGDFTNEDGTDVTGGDLNFQEPLWNISSSYDISDSVTVFGGISEAFELGSLARALADGTITDVASGVEGKKTTSYEVGLRGTFGSLDYSGVFFFSQSDNGETYDENLDLVLAKEEIKGIELTADYYTQIGLTFGGTATFMTGRYDTDGNGTLDSDLGTDRISPAKITAYAEYEYGIGAYRLDALHVGGRNPDSDQFTGLQTTEGYTLFDAAAQFEVGPGTLGVKVTNLFDTEYVPALQQSYSVEAYGYDDYYYVQGAGRAVTVSYVMEF